ncbi:BTB/POZ domain-containing protein At5g03250-like [Aristolochia californica]|uniref:BTB/POZ domain-containing protein At5g03250-like n=1 Tax=Aristolochia californica TaxID=171875 RepID=UPI0035DB056E
MACMRLGSKPEVFQRDGETWVCTTGLPSDIVVQVADMFFHLHKFPMLSRSGVLEKMIGDLSGEEGPSCKLNLNDIPGGAKSFELVAKFCYGVKIELTAFNVVALRCAAEHLQMTENHGEGNLISQTEVFLIEVFGSWKDTITALKTCEDVLLQAEELHIVSRCINSLAVKACVDPTLFSWPMSDCASQSPNTRALWNGIVVTAKPKVVEEDWWYEDVSFLNLNLYKRVIEAVEARGMNSESIAGSLMFYGERYIPGLSRHSSFCESTTRVPPGTSISVLPESEQRSLLEEIVDLLPSKKCVTSTKFLLGLLRTAMILHASPSSRENLEKRIGVQLDEAALEDLLIPNLGYSVETLYDVDCVQRILHHFMSLDHAANVSSPCIVDDAQLVGSPSLTPMTLVAKLVDGYLAEIAPDVNLKFQKFQSLASMIPDYARQLDDGIYRAIDIYLKSHPWLTDSEREQLCRLMNCQKLSLEACTHAAQNERLPLRVVVQVLFFEQLRLRTSIAGWFFVSDNLENTQASHGTLGLRNTDPSGEVDCALGSREVSSIGMDDMKLRVQELEKECLSMRQEIEMLGKPKSTWNSLIRKLWFRGKHQPTNAKEPPLTMQPESPKDNSRLSFDSQSSKNENDPTGLWGPKCSDSPKG